MLPIVLFALFKALREPRSIYPMIFLLLLAEWGYESWTLMPSFIEQRFEASPLYNEAARVHRYLTVGNLLDESCPDSSLLTSEIGALGETFHGRIIDGFGLATPEAIQFQPLWIPEEQPNGRIGAFSTGIVKVARPDVIVTYDFFAPSFFRSPLANEYERIQIPDFNHVDRTKAKSTCSLDSEQNCSFSSARTGTVIRIPIFSRLWPSKDVVVDVLLAFGAPAP